MKEPVRHLAGCTATRVAVGAFEKHVEVWDVLVPRCVGAFSTVLDFGGLRLCVDAAGGRCFAGAYRRFGVVGYNVTDGQVLWSRQDIKRVQYISRSVEGHLFVGVEDGPALLIDADDGRTLERLRGIRRVFEADAGTARLLDRSNPVVELASGRSFPVARTTTPGILDVAFGPESFCVSEAGGPTRCLDLENGREIWRYQPPQGEHLLSLAYCPSAVEFMGVSREYERTSEHALLQLGPGERLRRLTTLGRPARAEFCLSGEALVLADGRLLEASTEVCCESFPSSKIPDRECWQGRMGLWMTGTEGGCDG